MPEYIWIFIPQIFFAILLDVNKKKTERKEKGWWENGVCKDAGGAGIWGTARGIALECYILLMPPAEIQVQANSIDC